MRPLTPRTRRYLAEAEHDFDHYERSCEMAHWDWAIISLFYTALRLVQAYAEEFGPTRPYSHEDRAHFISYYLQEIEVPYRELETASSRARYRLWSIGESSVRDYHDRFFVPIRDHLRGQGIGW